MLREGAGFALPVKYKVLSVLGQGGMGVVLKVVDQQLERELAVKLLLFEGATESRAQARFMREAKTLALLNHPNIVKLLSFDVNEKGQPYMVMEFLEGVPLSKTIEEALPFGQFLEFFSGISSGLAHAHDNGIVHRDLKPGNIMISKIDAGLCPKIVDFGIAFFDEPSQDGKLTRTSALIGTPAYMSPEQCSGAKIDGRTDIYSLGAVMYEVLSGRPPFLKDTPLLTLNAVLHEDFVHLQDYAKSNAEIKLARLVDSCLSRDPDSRPQSAREILMTLEEIRQTQTSGTCPIKIRLDKKQSSKRMSKPLAITLAALLLIVIASTASVTLSPRQVSSDQFPVAQKRRGIRDVHGTKEKEEYDRDLNEFMRQFARYKREYERETDHERKQDLSSKIVFAGKKISSCYLHLQLYDKSESMLESLIPYANQLDSPELALPEIYSELARNQYIRGNYQKARDITFKVLRDIKKAGEDHDPIACDPYCLLALVYIKSRDYDAALGSYRNAKPMLLLDQEVRDNSYQRFSNTTSRSDDARCRQAIEIFDALNEITCSNLTDKEKLVVLEFRAEILDYLMARKSEKVPVVAENIKSFMAQVSPKTPGYDRVKKMTDTLLETVGQKGN